jgi:hypothetical protein
MRYICLMVIAAWLASFAIALFTRNIQHFGILHAACFVVGAASGVRVAFTDVPINRLWIVLGLPLALAFYAMTGDFLGWGSTVSWALIALSFIAGQRATNLLQMLQQRT